MVNKTETEATAEIIQDVEVIDAESSTGKSKTTLLWLAVVVLLCLQAGFYWLWNQQSSRNGTLSQQLSETQKTSQQNSASKKMAIANQTLLSSLEQQQQEITENINALNEKQQLSLGDVKQYWALAEVEYLLNIANQQVQLANDIVGAQRALEMADMRVKALSDYRFHPLRALLAEEQLALAAVADNDIEGIALQLQSALGRVDELQILMGPAVVAEGDQGIEAQSETLQAVLDQAWQEVKSLVVVRHQDGGAAAVLVPEQQYFLYQNLRLKLESTQLALLAGQQSVYEQNLNSAAQWLQQYFVGEERDAILEMVTSLQSQQITIDLPDISTSLIWLQQQGAQ